MYKHTCSLCKLACSFQKLMAYGNQRDAQPTGEVNNKAKSQQVTIFNSERKVLKHEMHQH